MNSNVLEHLYAVEGSIKAALSFNRELKHNYTYTALDGATTKVEQLESAVRSTVSEYESDLKLLESQFNSQQIKCLSLSSDNSKLKNQVQELQSQIESLEKVVKANRENLKKYHELKKLDPESLLRKIEKLEGQAIKQKEKSQTAYSNLQEQFSKKCNESKRQAERIEQLTSRTSEVPIKGRKGLLEYFPIIIESPLKFTFEDDSCELGSLNLEWHIEVLSSEGVSIHTGLTEWLMPIIPHSTELQKDWSSEVQEYIHQVALERVTQTHPDNVEMVKQAKRVSLVEVPEFTEKEQKLFEDLGLSSLFDVVSLNYTDFHRKACKYGFGQEESANCYDTINRYGLVYRKLYNTL